MKKFIKLGALLMLCLVCLCISRQTPKPELRVVTQVQITCRREDQTLYRYYRDPQKLKYVLYYLRRQDTGGYAATDPERIMGEDFWIRVGYSDGSCSLYRQRGDRYISRELGRWKSMDSQWGRRLYYLLYAVESDPVANPPRS